MVQEHSGLTRIYLPTFDLQNDIPEIGEIVGNTPTGELFKNHVTLNHRGLNWKIWYKLNPNNYHSFIIAFVLTAKVANPSYSGMWQLESNARRLEKALRKNNINLSECENDLIKLCKRFTRWTYTCERRKECMCMVLKKIMQQYLG